MKYPTVTAKSVTMDLTPVTAAESFLAGTLTVTIWACVRRVLTVKKQKTKMKTIEELREYKRDWMRAYRMTKRIQDGKAHKCAICPNIVLSKRKTCDNPKCRDKYAKKMNKIHTRNYNERIRLERKQRVESSKMYQESLI